MPVAVLIVNYRAYDDLLAALGSIRPFLDDADEIAVVDHVSDPVERARVEAAFPRLRIIARPDNIGFAAGVNLAARATTAPYLLLLNPDTIVEGPVVRTLEQWLDTHRDTAVVGPRILNADGSVQPSARQFPGMSSAVAGRTGWLTRRFPRNPLSRRNLPGRDATGPIDVDWIAGSCLMTRREVFDRVGGFDERFFLYWEDADYGRSVRALGFKSTFVPAVSVRHLGGRSAAYDLPGAIRTFHASAFRLYWKRAGWLKRTVAPVVWLALRTRAELRVRAERAPRHCPRAGSGTA